MQSANHFMETLENRRLLSGTVSDQVLGLQPDLLTVAVPLIPADTVPQPAPVAGFHFVPSTTDLTSVPTIAGFVYAGTFTTKPADVGNSGVPIIGSLTITITAQSANTLTGTVNFNGQNVAVTGHVNIHGNIDLWALPTNTGTNLLMAGQINQSGRIITYGSYQFSAAISSPFAAHPAVTSGAYATGHFSAVD